MLTLLVFCPRPGPPLAHSIVDCRNYLTHHRLPTNQPHHFCDLIDIIVMVDHHSTKPRLQSLIARALNGKITHSLKLYIFVVLTPALVAPAYAPL